MEEVVLVDEKDQEIGTLEKLKAHQEGKRHRAFSIFIFNTSGDMLLQKRADDKYHSGGLWSNACCSHQRPGEISITAANRRLQEEMGLQCKLAHIFTFEYKVTFDNGLTEHELDHVFIGVSNEKPLVNLSEASAFRYVDEKTLRADLHAHPDHYTEWFKLIVDKVWKHHKALNTEEYDT